MLSYWHCSHTMYDGRGRQVERTVQGVWQNVIEHQDIKGFINIRDVNFSCELLWYAARGIIQRFT